jgi:hypothetical protein
MDETARLKLPLLASGQAQKHVTVNEALARLDALTGAAVESRTVEGPEDAADGSLWLVPAGAAGLWAARSGQLAAASNGTWSFVEPEPGRRLWVRDEGREVVFDGAKWVDLGAPARLGAATALRVESFDHRLGPGAASLTAPIIRDKAVVIGVTGRVLEPLGPISGWSLGIEGAPGRYGTGYGAKAGAFAHGVTGSPLAYYGETRLLLEAEGGAFEGGLVRLALHLLEMTPPT